MSLRIGNIVKGLVYLGSLYRRRVDLLEARCWPTCDSDGIQYFAAGGRFMARTSPEVP
jgi:hypothetical protein